MMQFTMALDSPSEFAGQGKGSALHLTLSDKQQSESLHGASEVSNYAQTMGARRRRTLLILIAVWAISIFYVVINLDRGWIPHDEGTYAQSAERVLKGELPHRDFDDLYTGGMSFLNALAFSVLGTKLITLRIVLLVFFFAWIPAMFYIATRFASDIAAAAATLLALTWSIPNYSAAVPSWYNLSFALFGTVAIFRYLETRRRQWLFLAGLCGGLSILVKITGLYFVAAALLYFVFREQCHANETQKQFKGDKRIYTLFVTGSLLLFIALLFAMVRYFESKAYFVHFVLPGAALALFLLWREFQARPGNNGERFLYLYRMVTPFVLGISLPIAVYLIPYIRSGSLSALINGVFILPQLHITHTVMRPPPLAAMPLTLALAGVIICGASQRGTFSYVYSALVGVACLAGLVASADNQVIYRLIWTSLSFSIPATVLAGIAFLLWKWNPGGPPTLRGERFFLLVCLTAVWSLVQIPFSAPIYFCFVAPVLILTLLALFSSISTAPRFLLGTLLCLYLLFAVLRMTPGFIYHLGYAYYPDAQTKPFAVARGEGLRIQMDEALMYERLIPLIQEHAKGGYAYAAPDCPEVYFLSGLQNPTRTLFDFFDHPEDHTRRTLSAIEQNRVNVVAILTRPPFSGPLAPDLRAALTQRFPNSSTVGRFEVRWRQ
jgi:hypothetical protein